MTTSFIITAATVFSTLSNVSGTQSNSQYFYNADFQNGKVSQVNVLNNDGKYLSNKLSYRYTYDNQDRLIEKQTLLWDNTKHEWREYQVQRYDYASNKMTMTLSRWNKATQKYELAERYEYTQMMDNVVALTKEKFDANDKANSKADDAKKDVAISTEKVLLLNPGNDLAQAAQIFE